MLSLNFPSLFKDLNALKVLKFWHCSKLVSIPESFGDLICREALKQDGSALEFVSFLGAQV